MRKAVYILCGIFFAICIWSGLVSCREAEVSGDSELTLLMRSMEKDMKKVRKKVEKGGKKIDVPDWEGIYEARSSKSEMDTVTFNAFSHALLVSAEKLEAAENEEQHKVYNALVEVCMTCHSNMCPGPKVRIKKLYLPK